MRSSETFWLPKLNPWFLVRRYDLLSLSGKTRARDAALSAIQSPLLDVGIAQATGVVWNITGPSDMTLQEVTTAAKEINQLVDPEANLIFGAVVDDSLNGQVSITLIATGFQPMNGEVRESKKCVWEGL